MPRYKTLDTGPLLLPVDLARQLLPGSFEFAVDWIVDHHLDLSAFDARYRNAAAGAPADSPPGAPAMLLKVILVAYSRGIVSSREIAAACRDHITFIAFCGDTAPTSPPWPPSSLAWERRPNASSPRSSGCATGKA